MSTRFRTGKWDVGAGKMGLELVIVYIFYLFIFVLIFAAGTIPLGFEPEVEVVVNDILLVVPVLSRFCSIVAGNRRSTNFVSAVN